MTAESAIAAGNAQLVRVLSICLGCILVAVVPGAALLQHSGTGASLFGGSRDHLTHLPALGRRPIQPLPVPAGGAAAPRPPPPACDLKIDESAFAGSCTLLQDVCVDQGKVILYSPEHRPKGNGPPEGLPKLEPPERQSHFYLFYRGADRADQKAGLPAIHARPASSQEPRTYLAQPAFSSCTVPVVYYQHHSPNFAHTFRDNAGRFYSALKETAYEQHVKIVLMTGEGLNISNMNLDLWQPLSALRVESMADMSVRLTDEQYAAGGGRGGSGGSGPLPPSFEGTEQRCFKNMFVCTHDIVTKKWQLHAYGQHLVRHYRGEELVRSMPQQQPPGEGALPPLPPESILRQLGKRRKGGGGGKGGGGKGSGDGGDGAGSSSGSGSSGGANGEFQLRIVFQKRGGGERQLANAAELLERCNAWRYTAPSGARVRALCWEAEMPSLAAGIATTRQADILVGAHGANIANAWLLRPGSSVIELTMYEFELNPAHNNLARRNWMDVATEVQFWKLLLCDPAFYTPSAREVKGIAAGAPPDPVWAKYRNLIVRWEALETAFRAVVDTAGDMATYGQRWEEGNWWWLSTTSQTVPAGPNTKQTCSKARNQGLIE